MRPPTLIALSLLLAVGVAGGTLEGRAGAQYSERSLASRYPLEWETDLFRVQRIAIAPRAQMTAPHTDGVLVFLTADLDGRMPPAEAVFQPGGARTLENRGIVPFEAISIGLKDVPPTLTTGTPPEALPLADLIDVRTLIDNPRVVVLKTRYRPNAYSGPLHFHSKDIVVIYLGGGHTWPVNGLWGSYRVARGDIDLVPANTLHTFGNAGGDPLDVLVIVPK
jgi:mannose-6-phosphate isomerase-like protein (cupin superfamily)